MAEATSSVAAVQPVRGSMPLTYSVIAQSGFLIN
jgi:hypothetical protein